MDTRKIEAAPSCDMGGDLKADFGNNLAELLGLLFKKEEPRVLGQS